MTTSATGDQPEIEWKQGSLEDTDSHMTYYLATGVSADGREWIGTWEEVDGEFSEISDIEEA